MITLDTIHKHYPGYHALRGISAQIGAGEFFSLLGPSGCGKTTLLRVMAGFEDPSEGRVTIDGRDMDGVAAHQRPTNMVFQSYAIFPHMSVGQNVGFGLRKSGMSAAEQSRAVSEALAMVGLAGYEPRAAHALSGGQRQRVALARALILKPKVLLLDEPLSALDKKLRDQMQQELRRLQRQLGITFVLVTHDQEEALTLSDRIAVMFEGEIAQLAPPQELYRRPVNRRVAEFIGEMTFLPASPTASGVDIAGLGTIDSTDEQTMTTAGPARVAGLRPETLSLLPEGSDQTPGAQTAAGQIKSRAYYGDMTYYEVQLEGTDHAVSVSMKNTASEPLREVGSQARIAWDPRAIVLFDA